MGIFSIFGNVKKHTAAMNALVAKATYAQLDDSLKKAVDNRAIAILEKGWKFSREKAIDVLNNEPERTSYGFKALAMLELNVNPISRNWQWQIVSNPYTALDEDDRQIDVARKGLFEREGIAVKFNDLSKMDTFAEKLIASTIEIYTNMDAGSNGTVDPHLILVELMDYSFGEWLRSEMTNEEYAKYRFNLTQKCACIPPPDNARALALWLIIKHHADEVDDKYGEQFDRLMRPVQTANENGRLMDLYTKFNPRISVESGVTTATAPVKQNTLKVEVSPASMVSQEERTKINDFIAKILLETGRLVFPVEAALADSNLPEMKSANYSQFVVETIMLFIYFFDKALFDSYGASTKKRQIYQSTITVLNEYIASGSLSNQFPKFINECDWNEKMQISSYYRHKENMEVPPGISLRMSIFDPIEELYARCTDYSKYSNQTKHSPGIEGTVYERFVENVQHCVPDDQARKVIRAAVGAYLAATKN